MEGHASAMPVIPPLTRVNPKTFHLGLLQASRSEIHLDPLAQLFQSHRVFDGSQAPDSLKKDVTRLLSNSCLPRPRPRRIRKPAPTAYRKPTAFRTRANGFSAKLMHSTPANGLFANPRTPRPR